MFLMNKRVGEIDYKSTVNVMINQWPKSVCSVEKPADTCRDEYWPRVSRNGACKVNDELGALWGTEMDEQGTIIFSSG
jgi:hypothetical protein